MSRAKIERRKRRARLAAERERRERVADDVVDEDEPSRWTSRSRRQQATEPVAARTWLGGLRDDPPPLPLALGSLLTIGFMANLIVGGFANLGRNPFLGALLIAVGGGLAAAAFLIFKRSFVGWLVSVVALSIVVITYLAGALTSGNGGILVFAVFPALPLVLLFMPGSRAELNPPPWRKTEATDD